MSNEIMVLMCRRTFTNSNPNHDHCWLCRYNRTCSRVLEVRIKLKRWYE